MLRSTILAAVAAFGLSSVAEASMMAPAISGNDGSFVIKIAEGCGGGEWRGPQGHCHHFDGPGGNNRGTEFACPDGYHIGTRHDRCYPD